MTHATGAGGRENHVRGLSCRKSVAPAEAMPTADFAVRRDGTDKGQGSRVGQHERYLVLGVADEAVADHQNGLTALEHTEHGGPIAVFPHDGLDRERGRSGQLFGATDGCPHGFHDFCGLAASGYARDPPRRGAHACPAPSISKQLHPARRVYARPASRRYVEWHPREAFELDDHENTLVPENGFEPTVE